MSDEMIVTSVTDRVALITLNRPKALNALNDQLMDIVCKPPMGVIHTGGSLFQLGIGADHFGWNQLLSDAEMF
jgi:hypothetical protein